MFQIPLASPVVGQRLHLTLHEVEQQQLADLQGQNCKFSNGQHTQSSFPLSSPRHGTGGLARITYAPPPAPCQSCHLGSLDGPLPAATSTYPPLPGLNPSRAKAFAVALLGLLFGHKTYTKRTSPLCSLLHTHFTRS